MELGPLHPLVHRHIVNIHPDLSRCGLLGDDHIQDTIIGVSGVHVSDHPLLAQVLQVLAQLVPVVEGGWVVWWLCGCELLVIIQLYGFCLDVPDVTRKDRALKFLYYRQ